MIQQKQIAEKAGVSYATVSRALTHSAKVKPETMARIRKAMEELGITNADDLFLGRSALSKMVLVVVCDIVKEFMALVVQGIYQHLYAKGYSVSLCLSNFDANMELSCMRNAAESGYAGIIMVTTVETPDMVRFIQSTKIPVVMVNRYISALDLDVVRIDNYRGGYIAGKYLLDRGHRRIAVLAGPRNSSSAYDRVRGFISAMTDNLIPFCDEDVMFGDLLRSSGRRFAREMLGNGYTAAFITNNDMTIGAVHELQKQGKQIPQDISFIAFDDSALVNEDGLNITTISGDPLLMGTTTAEVLLERIENPLGEHRRIIYSPHLTVRGSVRSLID